MKRVAKKLVGLFLVLSLLLPGVVVPVQAAGATGETVAEVKTYINGQEVSMEQPMEVSGSFSGNVVVKARMEGNTEFTDVTSDWRNLKTESLQNGGELYGSVKITFDGTNDVQYRVTYKGFKHDFLLKLKKEVPVTSISVRVPAQWEIDGWNGLGGYYVGIQKGHRADQFNYSVAPDNASNKNLKWEALTPDIAEYMEAFDNGIVPKKAGTARFRVSSESNPTVTQEVSVEFRYKYPLQKVESEKNVYTVEVGNTLDVNLIPTPANATEQRFAWSYDIPDIVAVTDSVGKDSQNVNVKWTTHTISALKAGEVTVVGKALDDTANCPDVSFTVRVTENGVIPGEVDALTLAKENIAHGLTYTQSQVAKLDPWNIFTTLRAGGSISKEILSAYENALSEKLKAGTEKLMATDIARESLALAAMGKDLTNYNGVNLMQVLYTDSCKSEIGKSSSNNAIYALIALDLQKTEIPADAVWTRKKLIDHILTYQTAEGSFGLFDNQAGSIDMTAMALQALAPYRTDEAYPEVHTAFENALAYLKASMTPTIGFTDQFTGENSCSNAQVLTALCVASIDPVAKENGFTKHFHNLITSLNDYKVEQGFTLNKGGKDAMAMPTQQVTYALEAYRRFVEKKNSLYDFSDVKIENPGSTENGFVTISVERFTIGQGYFVEPVRVPFEKGENAKTLLEKVIGKQNYIGQSNYMQAIKGADLGVDHVKIPAYISEISKNDRNPVTTESAKAHGAEQNGTALGEFDYSQYAGWMYFVNNENVNYGIADYKPVDGDVLRFQFTVFGYGTDLTGYQWGNPEPLVAISNKDLATKTLAMVTENKEAWMTIPEVKTAYEQLVEKVAAMVTAQAEVDQAAKALENALKDAGYPNVPEAPEPQPEKPVELPYKDVKKGDWFYDGVAYTFANKLMTGLNATTFGPTENLARAQFAVILHRMNGTPKAEYKPTFADVSAGQWYTDAILWANSIGVVTGYSNSDLFGTGDNINREQMAVMMYRYAKHMGYNTSKTADLSSFKDAKNVNAFAKDAMSWAVGEGIITGVDNGTKLDPQGSAVRGQCAIIIQRFMNAYK